MKDCNEDLIIEQLTLFVTAHSKMACAMDNLAKATHKLADLKAQQLEGEVERIKDIMQNSMNLTVDTLKKHLDD